MLSVLWPTFASAQRDAGQRASQSTIEVSKLEVRYSRNATELDNLPTLRELLFEEVELVERGAVLDAPGLGRVVRSFKLFELVSGGRTEITSAGLDAVLAALDASLRGRGFPGLTARPDGSQLERIDGIWSERRVFSERVTIVIDRRAGDLGLVAGRAVGANVVPPPAGAVPGPAIPWLVPTPADGTAFELTSVELTYQREHPQHPSIQRLLETLVVLTPTPEGFVAPRAYGPVIVQPIGEIAREAPAVLYSSALATISSAISAQLRDLGLIGIFVEPSPRDVAVTGSRVMDLRADAAGPFEFVVYTSIVTRVGSSATGDRISLERRIDHPYHRRIRERSPVRPWAVQPGQQESAGESSLDSGSGETSLPVNGDPASGQDSVPGAQPSTEPTEDSAGETTEQPGEERRDLLRYDVLNEYALRLNRHPGRTVDVAVAPGEGQLEAELQYTIREDKPWTLFTQLSNTGTESTSEFRQRFGFTHTQFTNADDVLSIDYTTAEFDSANAVVGSYQRPILGSEKLRWSVVGGYNEFTAADVGSGGASFTGESYFISLEVSGTIAQANEFILDAFAGVRFQDITVEDRSIFSTGPASEAIFLPRVGLRASRLGGWSSLSATAQLEWTQNSVTGATEESLQDLGRLGPESEWVVFNAGVSASVFLEPLLSYDAWADPSTPGSSTLAHEVFFRLSGQYAFNSRLIPNAEGVIGGLFTVRGYPESLAAGDSTYSGSVEYRFHLPRTFAIDPEPSSLFGRPFRVSPQQAYGSPDWDLVLKAFFDFGQTFISQPLGFEQEETLASVGVGFEVQLYRNLSFRTDVGWVLSAVGTDGTNRVDRGDERVHLLFTLAY
ncbi:MAG: hypothetical protein AAF297_01110 [Planctomycetota bacterium]